MVDGMGSKGFGEGFTCLGKIVDHGCSMAKDRQMLVEKFLSVKIIQENPSMVDNRGSTKFDKSFIRSR